jgi:hypothetical protein
VSVSKEFEELFMCLNARGVKAVIVGAYAVAFHGKPRFTKDIDILSSRARTMRIGSSRRWLISASVHSA